jgi:FAD-dependent fumarate reductase
MTRRQLLFIALATALTVFFYHWHYYYSHTPASQGPTSTSQTMPPTPQSPTVIVVGAGLAGLSASYSALRAGAAVRLLERADKPGGNSIKASSGINGAPTRFQKGPGTDTSFHSDTVRSAGARLARADDDATAAAVKNFRRAERESLITRLTTSSAQAVDFLVDEIGVDLSVVAQLGGHSFPRTHRGAGKLPPGAAIVTGMLNKLKQDPNFQLQTGCEVSKILTLPGDKATVTGVQYTQEGSPHTLEGAVVFTTGGFAGDTWGLLKQYRPDLAGLPSTNDNRPGTHHMLQDLGAHLVDMDSVQVHPTGFILPSDPQARVKFLAAEMLRGEGGILLHKGKRFVNEMDTREHVSKVIMSLPPTKQETPANKDGASETLTQWDVELLLDPGACEAAASHIGFYTWKGLVTKMKVKYLDETTRQTICDYSQVVAGKAKDPLGRTVFGSWKLTGTGADDDEQEVCVGRVTPITHFTMGGAAINDNSQVLVSDSSGAGSPSSSGLRPVQGLWAAGEITGGLHGDNRLGGSSLLECVVFGRAAGQGAAAYAKAAAV